MSRIAEKVKKSQEKMRGKKNGISQADFSKIHENMNAAQKEVYNQLTQINDTAQQGEMAASWEVGRIVANVSDDKNEKTYGKGFVQKLSRLLNHSTSYLYERMRFYNKVPDAKFKQLANIRMRSTNTPITYSHVVSVLELEDNVFWDYLNKAAEHSFTVAQLKTLVREHKNTRTNKNGRGRAVNVPSDFKGQLDNIEQTLSPLCKRAIQWNDETKGVAAALVKLPKDKLNQQWVERLSRVYAEINRSIELLSTLSDSLKSAYGNMQGDFNEETEVPAQDSTKKIEKSVKDPEGPWRSDSTLAALGFDL